MATVILGAGMIGVSTAYYLSNSTDPSTIHLVEPSPTLFASASGYAGGFLAADWVAPPSASLAALSFEEHKRLAQEHNGREKWKYSKSSGCSYTFGSNTISKNGYDWVMDGSSRAGAAARQRAVVASDSEFADKDGEGKEPRWLRVGDGRVEVISEEGTTAQLDPLKLCQFLLSQCLERGVQLHHPAKAVSIGKDTWDELASVRVASTDSSTETDIPCTRMIIAAGCWTPQVFQTLFPDSMTRIPITPLAGHSLVVRSPRWTIHDEKKGCHSVFTTNEDGWSTELFSRLGGEIYVAGLNSSSIPLPNLATESKVDDDAIDELKKVSRTLLGPRGNGEDLEVVRTGLCFRPVTRKGVPILSRIDDDLLGDQIKTKGGGEGGVFVAAGHGPWGISMSLGTGKVMADMVMGRKLSVDVSRLTL